MPISGRATRPSPGTAAKGPKRRRQRGRSTKLGYPAKSSSPPSPDSATLRPASFAAFATNQVLTPSIEGWSIAAMMAGRSSRNSRSPTRRTMCRAPIALRHLPGERRFVLGRAAELVEGERDARGSRAGRRPPSGREAPRNRHRPRETSRPRHPPADGRGRCRARRRAGARRVRRRGPGARRPLARIAARLAKGLRLARPRRIDPLRVPGRQGANIAVERERLGHAAEQMKAGDPRRLGIARNPAAREQCLDLRGEAERPAVVCGVERLDAVGVAGEKELAPLSRPRSRKRTCRAAGAPSQRRGARRDAAALRYRSSSRKRTPAASSSARNAR